MDKEVTNFKEKLFSKLREYRYVLLVLALGLLLLLLPSGGEKAASDGGGDAEGDAKAQDQEPLERRLERILSLVDGAGDVRVLLTYADDGERILAYDSRTSQETSSQGGRSEEESSAVTVPQGGGSSDAVEVSYRYPGFRGAVVVAQGADSAQVRLELMEAVKAATGLGSENIKIVKMTS